MRAGWQLYSPEPWNHLISLAPDDLAQHALLLGATGSGKTNLLQHMILQDVGQEHSVCVLDMRGDLVATVASICCKHDVDAKRVRIIDLREKVRPFGFNPLFGPGEPYFRALSVLDVIASESESWGVQLAESLRFALLLLTEAGKPLTRIEHLFYDRTFRDDCLRAIESESVLNFWLRFDALSPDRQAAMASPVLNKVSLLLSTPSLRRTLGHPAPFDLGEHLNRKGSITLVSLAVDEMHGAGRMMGSLILASVCREVFSRVNVPLEKRNPVRLYVDEFEHFGVDDFKNILAEARKFKLPLVLAHQTLSQLTPQLRSLILGNVGVKLVFRTGREDSVTMSKDLFRDGQAYDFTELPTGVAVLWRKDLGVDEVEINEPLILPDAQSSEVREYLRKVYELAGSAIKNETAPRENLSTRARLTSPNGNIEDWLCE